MSPSMPLSTRTKRNILICAGISTLPTIAAAGLLGADLASGGAQHGVLAPLERVAVVTACLCWLGTGILTATAALNAMLTVKMERHVADLKTFIEEQIDARSAEVIAALTGEIVDSRATFGARITTLVQERDEQFRTLRDDIAEMVAAYGDSRSDAAVRADRQRLAEITGNQPEFPAPQSAPPFINGSHSNVRTLRSPH